MAEPFLGEIRMFAFSNIPKGWVPCNGQVLPITQNQALYSIIGKTYGGDGVTNFALPNLQGRVPLQPSNAIQLGAAGGEASHTLTVNEMPIHTHTLSASSQNGSTGTAATNVWAASKTGPRYEATANTPMAATALATSGASNGHSNMQPYTVGSYCIATVGIFPPRP